MQHLQLVHWNEPEARERLRALRRLGFRVAHELDGAAAARAVREEQPDAVVIDLTRLPSHGREIGWYLRQGKKTRAIPLVFVGGLSEKVARVRKELPDAVFTEWDDVDRAIRTAIERAPREPVVPRSTQFYGTKSLAAKLGVKPGTTVAALGAPKDFAKTLGVLPEGAALRTDLRGKAGLAIWFLGSVKDYAKALPRMRKAAEQGTLVWAAWPKKTSGVATDLTEKIVRESASEHDLVDYKVCRIDDTWTGYALGQRRTRRKA